MLWISSEWSYKLFFFFPQQTHGKIFFSVVWLAWKLATAASFPGSDSSDLSAWVISLKGTRNLHVMQSCLTSMKQGSAGVTLVYTATAGGRFGGSVFQEKYETQQRNNQGLLRVVLSPWAVFPLPASMVSALVGAADRFDTITESNSGSWYPQCSMKGPRSP